jgi:hypothetical protein
MFYLVTGDFPVYARSVEKLRQAHRDGNRQFLTEVRPDLPASFVRVVERALTADPAERYPSAAAFLDELRTVLRQEPAKRESITEKLIQVFYVVYVVVGATCFAGFLGMLASVMFNHALGLSSFADDSVRELVIWGAKSTLLPVLIMTTVVVIASHVAMVVRLAAGRLRRSAFLDAFHARLDYLVRGLRLNDVTTAASIALVVTTASVVGALWYFYPLLVACFQPISTAPAANLALLSPELADTYHNYFRETFTVLVLLSVAAWWTVLKLASRHGQRVNRSMLAGGVGVTIVAVAILSLPYRLLRHSEFEVATWNGNRC